MTPRGSDWSELEVEAVVVDYFEMFRKELLGEPYNKSEHRRRLLLLLAGRSEGAIEYKHQNISAALIDLGQPYIEGYKPQRNYQELLLEVVRDRLDVDSTLLNALDLAVREDVPVPEVSDILKVLVDPPRLDESPWAPYSKERRTVQTRAPNHLLREARNASLGQAGELFVLNFERARLLRAGRDRLAADVEHVSVTKGDAEGFDVLSYEEDGRERLIEVKTTRFGSSTPFFVSRNQVAVSSREGPRYHVYRAFGFRREPRLFCLRGPIDGSCDLEPTEYLARPTGAATLN